MKKTLFLIMMLCCHIVAVAQMSRRALEKYYYGGCEADSPDGAHADYTTFSIRWRTTPMSASEMLSRMGDADDVRQQHACLKLIDDIVAYSLKPTGMKYVDVVRQGLKKRYRPQRRARRAAARARAAGSCG